MKCFIFRCSKKDEMYLYTPHQENESIAIDELPKALLEVTGRLTLVMEIELSEEKKLARANAVEVINSLREKGYYLQSPPNAVIRNDSSMLNDSTDGF